MSCSLLPLWAQPLDSITSSEDHSGMLFAVLVPCFWDPSLISFENKRAVLESNQL